jgi:hypothetical protein
VVSSLGLAINLRADNFRFSSFRPSKARAGIQPALEVTTLVFSKIELDSRPGLLSAGVTFFRRNDEYAVRLWKV